MKRGIIATALLAAALAASAQQARQKERKDAAGAAAQQSAGTTQQRERSPVGELPAPSTATWRTPEQTGQPKTEESYKGWRFGTTPRSDDRLQRYGPRPR